MFFETTVLIRNSESLKSFGGLVAKSRPTLVTPWTVFQAPLSIRILHMQEHWSGFAHFPFKGIFPIQELSLGHLHCSTILYQLEPTRWAGTISWRRARAQPSTQSHCMECLMAVVYIQLSSNSTLVEPILTTLLYSAGIKSVQNNQWEGRYAYLGPQDEKEQIMVW